MFSALGLNTKDLVTFVGGHTISTTSFGLLRRRLYNFNGTNGPDPTIDPSFLLQLQVLCPQNGGASSKRVPLDNGSQTKFDTSYFNNVKKGRGILQSDQALWTDPCTKALVQRYSLGLTFNVDFGNSMVKMSNIGVQTGSEGEICKKCSTFT
ncbi:hypothetical protein Ahy_B04g072765 [Arachis hypogaea]|uniref:peroxidase n=1 Tax=Arachis hypogaea TaxID=3818 RepID=A0A444ZNN7_ARAHY|nr:hypothetical protein Ahy_B04g072765 [Arachis hypogaea]